MTQPTPQPTPGDPTPTPAPPKPGPPPGDPTPADPPKDDKPLGPGGERALASEREARKALEKQLAELSPLKKLAEALAPGQPNGNGKSEVELLNERFAQHEKDLAEERGARWRAEVAHEKGLSPQQAARLQGGTRDEMAADADALIALFPAATSRTPMPDPSQGPRGTMPADLEAQIAEAQRGGDYRKVIALQKQKLATATK